MTCVPRRCDWMPLWTGEGEAEMDKNSIVGHHGSGGGEGGRTKRAAKWGLIQLGAHHRAKTFLCTRHTQHSLAHTHKHTGSTEKDTGRVRGQSPCAGHRKGKGTLTKCCSKTYADEV